MNTFSSSSSAATHSPQPADLDPLAFSTASSMQQPPSVSPCPSSSLHAGHHVSLQQPSETYDHDSANTNSNVSITAINTSNTNTSANTTSSKNALTRISSNPVVATTSTVVTTTTVVPPMLHDYWHGQTPLLLHNDPLRGDLDSVEVNHSERGIAGFVSKLYQSLQAPDDGQKYARWCKHDGKDMFIIECIPKFTEVVLPRLFKHCKFASFVRQLNIYGFQRDTDARKTKDTKDKESCRWHHQYFRPGRRDLFHLIRRKAARYPRRKRVKIDEDPATIVNVGSGDDDSDIDMNITCVLDDRRRSSSVSSVSQQPQDSYSNHHHDNHHSQQPQQQQQDSTSFQMMYEGLPDLSVGTTGVGAAAAPQSIPVQEPNQQQHAAAPAVPAPAPAPAPPPPPPQKYQQQQTPSPCNPPGEVETSEVYNITPVTEAPHQHRQQQVDWVSQHQQHQQQQQQQQQQQHKHHQHHQHQHQQNNEPLDHRLLQEQDLRAQVTRLSQLCQGMRRSFDMQMKKAYKLIEDQGRRIQMLESDSFRGSNQNSLQQQQQQSQHQQQHQQRSSDMGYMMSTPFSNHNHHHHSPHNDDLYTQFFPSNTNVRIKTEIGAAAAAAVAATAAGGFNNGGGTGDRTDYENLYGLKLEAATTAATASTAPSPHHHQQHQHHHHPHSQIQQQQQQQQARPSMMKPSDPINQQQQQQPSWMPMFAAVAANSNASATDTPNSIHFHSNPPARSGAAASIAAAAAVAAAAVAGEPSNNNNAPGDIAATAAAYGHPGLPKYHHHPNRGI